MPSSHHLENRLAASWPPEEWRELGVLVAVSGGADSVALLRALAAIKGGGAGSLVAAHFNHRLRGQESDGDAQFVVDLCRQLGVPCEVGSAAGDLRGQAAGDGLEAAARRARYEFLAATAHRLGVRHVVTAHTADDQAETILHRIVRGTGVAGLAGIRRVRPLGSDVTLLRPMLEIRRPEVLEYLTALGQAFREDATNSDLRFTRNRIRHELVPKLAEYSPGVVESLLRLGQLSGEAQAILSGLADDLHERCVSYPADGTAIVDCRDLSTIRHYLVREMFVIVWRRREWPAQQMGFDEWQSLAEMAMQPRPAKRVFPGQIMAQRDEDLLLLARTG